ncbi:MAG: paraquat-inducible protein A [Desulfobacteraceae bacterium]|nr:paraquat-inducible protein A [Desulfobacteraceae bacterium]
MQTGTPTPLTAREAGLVRCHDCGKLVRMGPPGAGAAMICPRCHASAHFRKPDSVQRTWALLFASAIFFVPANILPIMEVTFLGNVETSTIMDGIVYFFQHGPWAIGLIIFTASVLVPSFKIIGLAIILLSLHFRWHSWLRHKTVMFRFITFIGRWSMLDIFVIALLCVLMNFASLSSVTPAPAAAYFCAVVVLTMLAAGTLDPRLLWDAAPSGKETPPAAAT